MIIEEGEYLAHYGVLRRSGRYPWGSGENEDSHNRSLLGHIKDMRGQGLSDPQIAKGLGLTTTQLRAENSRAKNQQNQAKIAFAQKLKDKGTGTSEIGRRMGLNESSVRALLAPGAKDKADILISTSEMLKAQVEKKGLIDIGSGVESHIGLSKERLNTAVHILKEQGYEVHNGIKVRQLGTGKDTELKVLGPPGTTWGDVQKNKALIRQIDAVSSDGGRTYNKEHKPLAIKPTRVDVKYKENGGAEADGVIYVRPGVPDISLGTKSRYAQVRIQVGDGHYLKGMAMYKHDLPVGTDLVFNSNKTSTGNKLDAMKPLKKDSDLPFGAVVRPILADAGTVKERVTSVMNLVNEEGDWRGWAKNISAQVLSKQSPSLARSQLNITQERRQKDFDKILALTNPTIKKKLLESFADGADSAAVHLKAAALPNANWHAILPIDSMPPSQIYAPGYHNGERVVLIRYPHGGTFEIPELTVNNKQPEAKRLLGGAVDAVGIHHSVAQRLSGADFDGDTVLVIPNDHNKIKTSPALEVLKTFDPVSAYPAYPGMPELKPGRKQQLMGDVSNLITDMTLKGASHEHLSRAVRHSMVVIDAEKKHLNYKQSALDFGIKQLKIEYQGASRGGASTLISRKKSEIYLPETKARSQMDGGPIDTTTGRKVTVETGRTTRNRDGTTKIKKVFYNKLAITEDAHSLSSGTRIENIYADHSNKLKAMANQARLAAHNTPPLVYSPSANKAYANEVASLDAKLNLAIRNRPLERQAQILANAVVRAKREANPNLDHDQIKKIEYQEQERARIRTGATKRDIKITQEEWNAIQSGAISNHKLNQILNKADLDLVKDYATPQTAHLMTTSKTQRARTMLENGATRAEVASQLGVSLTTLDTAIKGEA